MTFTQTAVSKFAVAIVAAAMMFAAFAPAANAQNVEDMSLEELLALVAALQGEVSVEVTSTAAVCPYTWTRTLNMGSTGADVMALQKFLNSMPETQVAPVGSAGSAGMETSYYGPATGAAVANFQMKYRAEILSPLGLVNATTFFGPSTMAQANKLCATSVVIDGDDDDDDDTTSGSLSGEASLRGNVEVDDGEQDEVEEGEENASVAVFTFEFRDGDAELSRLDIRLDTDTDDSTSLDIDPWDVFEEFSLWVDDEEVETIAADDEDDYLDEDDGTLRFTNLGIIAEEDEEVEITIAASIQNNVDNSDLGDWYVYGESARFFDADGVAETLDANDFNDEAMFTVEEAGFEEELMFRDGDDNPEATTIVVDKDTARTRNVEIMQYEIEADGGDIDLDRLFVNVVAANTGTATTSLDDIIDDVRLEIDGEEFDHEGSITDTAGDLDQRFEFDIDGDITIDEDDSVNVTVIVDFKGSDEGVNFANGTTIMAQVRSGTDNEVELTKAEGADDVAKADLRGSAESELHSLVAEGIVVPAADFDASERTTGADNNVGEYTIKFDVMAVEGDFTVARAGVAYEIRDEDNNVVAVALGTRSATLTSTGDEVSSNTFEVRDGQTETFTLKVNFNPASGNAGDYRVVLTGVTYAGEGSGTQNLTPEQDYDTDYLYISEEAA